MINSLLQAKPIENWPRFSLALSVLAVVVPILTYLVAMGLGYHGHEGTITSIDKLFTEHTIAAVSVTTTWTLIAFAMGARALYILYHKKQPGGDDEQAGLARVAVAMQQHNEHRDAQVKQRVESEGNNAIQILAKENDELRGQIGELRADNAVLKSMTQTLQPNDRIRAQLKASTRRTLQQAEEHQDDWKSIALKEGERAELERLREERKHITQERNQLQEELRTTRNELHESRQQLFRQQASQDQMKRVYDWVLSAHYPNPSDLSALLKAGKAADEARQKQSQ